MKSASAVVSHIRTQPHICLELFWLVNGARSVQVSLHFFTAGCVIMTRILVKNVLMLDLFQLLPSQDFNWWCGLLWCFYQLFEHSIWRHPFTQSKWCNATFLQIWWRNKVLILDFHFCLNYSFKCTVGFFWFYLRKCLKHACYILQKK